MQVNTQTLRHFEQSPLQGFATQHRSQLQVGNRYLHADNGAVATKIRQMSQRLCNELSKKELSVAGSRVKVQPNKALYQ